MNIQSLVQTITEYGDWAPWILFVLILLAGANIPISIDIIIVAAAFLSATIFPEKVYLFFFTFMFGCIFSAWISYWLGRSVGRKIFQISFFAKFVSEERVDKVASFYKRYGFWTFLVGRFIPFGVRCGLFMSSGIAKMSFPKFILFDFIACTIWSTIFFFGLYHIGQDYEMLLSHLKIINISLFIAFCVSIICLICYKVFKRKKSTH